MTHESAGVGQEFPIRPERQFECAVADEVVSSMVTEHGFVEGSTMPSYRTTLSRQELADLIAYLATLKGVEPQ